MKIIKILLISIVVLIIGYFLIWRLTQMAIERECGWNPLNHLKAKTNELWCVCDPTIDLDNNDSGFYYGGFSCMDCERFCEKYGLGDCIEQPWDEKK